MRKRAFLLIEVLLAMAVLSIALPSLIKGMVYLHRAKIFPYERMGRELVAREAFIDLKASLFEGKWRECDFQERVEGTLNSSSVPTLPGLKGRNIQRLFVVRPLEKYSKKNGAIRFILAEAEIILMEGEKKRESFFYPLFLIQDSSS